MLPANPDSTNTANVEAAIQEEALPPLPRKRGEPVFQDSWEAEAFAMGNILVKEGLVSCREWMDLMAEAIRMAQAAGDLDSGDTYYLHWCSALEALCFQRGLISPEAYQDLLFVWAQAIANTPHGVALSIENAATDSQHPAELHHQTHTHTHTHGHGHGHSHGDASQAPPPHYWTPIHVTTLRNNPSER
jgi:nitrile hydratase accessory protein